MISRELTAAVWRIAPKVWTSSSYDHTADVFSFGVLAYEVLARRRGSAGPRRLLWVAGSLWAVPACELATGLAAQAAQAACSARFSYGVKFHRAGRCTTSLDVQLGLALGIICKRREAD